MRYKNVWVVSYWNAGEEPVFTVFSNEESARKYFDFNCTRFDKVAIDEAPVYGKFLIGDEINEP